MFKVKIITIGKHKESWLLSALKEYEKRLSDFEISWLIVKDDSQLEKIVNKSDSYICLDSFGKSYSSEGFSLTFFSWLEEMGSKITIIIGGDKGLNYFIKKKAKYLLSLSPLTFTHQMTRIILLEQIYRADQIRKGTNYQK